MVRVARGPAAWAKRGLIAAVLLAAAVIPGRAASQQSPQCTGQSCRTAGSILWKRDLPGSWLAESGVAGTVTSDGSAYAAVGGGLAVVGVGNAVSAFQATTGEPLWDASLSGVAVGSSIVGVRAFTGIVAVGVVPPAGQAGGREEVILDAATGRQIRTYPAAAYGGAIAADSHSTVIVGPRAVTAYANSTGRELWSRVTGTGEEAWRVSGRYVYVTQTAGSGAGSPVVTAVRRIDLQDGAIKRLQPPGTSFDGSLAGAVQGVLLFSAADGVTAYSASNGRQLWTRARSVLELTDPVMDAFYLASGKTLTGIQASTGRVISQAGTSVSASLYWAADGTALGLDDQGALGQAWGYDLATKRVVWTSSGLPWPHFFVDLSGLGGSASPGSDVVLLAICGQEGKALTAASAPECLRPELAAVLA